MDIRDKEIISKGFFPKSGKFFSWSAVVVGALVGIGISFLLNLFGISIGLAAFRHATNTTNLTFALGGFLGLLIASIVSMSALGAVAGYLGAIKKLECNKTELHCNYGCLYGFTAWCLALVLSIILAIPAGKFLYYTTTALSNPTSVFTTDYKRDRTSENRLESNRISTTPEETAKQLALTSFLSFILFFIGAISATIAGHLAFERYTRKHGNYIKNR